MISGTVSWIVEQVPAVHEGIAVAVVLDLGTEQLAEPKQQLGLVGDCVHPRQEEQAAPFADRGTERFGLRFERRHRLAGADQRRESHRRAEGGIGEGSELAEAVGTIGCGGCRADTFAVCGHDLAPVRVSAVPQPCAGSSALQATPSPVGVFPSWRATPVVLWMCIIQPNCPCTTRGP